MRDGLSVWMLTAMTFLGLHVTGFGQEATEKKEEKVPDAPVQQPKKDENTPEGALSKFLKAMATRDQEALKSVALPDDDLEILFKGEEPTAANLARLQVAMALSPMKRLRVGDEIKLPGGRTLVIDETRVNKDRQSINAMGSPIPFDVQLIEGKWKVNAQPLIASRRALQKAIEDNKKGDAAKKDAGK